MRSPKLTPHYRLPGVVYPPPDEIARYVRVGALGNETLVDAWHTACTRYPDHIALRDTQHDLTYAALDEQSSRLAAGFLSLGLVPLQRVVFQLTDRAELIIALIACLKAGLIPLCTLSAHREREIGYLANLAEARLHLVDGDDAKFDGVAFARKMQHVAPSLSHIVRARGLASANVPTFAQLIEATSLAQANRLLAAVELDAFQVAIFQLSGGTTGVPKIIPRFHNDYVCNMRAVAAWLDYRSDDVLFAPQPLLHNMNLGCCFGPMLLSGGTVTLAHDRQPETQLQLIHATRPSWLVLVGPFIARLEAAVASGRIGLTQARGIITMNNAKKLHDMLHVPVHTIFGITEGVITLTHADDPVAAKETTHGRPVCAFDEIRIVEPGTHVPLALGEIGESAFKGPYTTHGYYRAPERNRETFTADGRYLSGDLMQARLIEGKTYYAYCGRIKDLVSRGGEKINCSEVETAVAGHPAVAAVAAVPYPDPDYDERLAAVLILREGFAAPTLAELGAYLKDYGLAKFKWPERIEIVAAFPLTAAGKLNRAALKDEVRQKSEAEATVAVAA